jgi:hypothetical protein
MHEGHGWACQPAAGAIENEKDTDSKLLRTIQELGDQQQLMADTNSKLTRTIADVTNRKLGDQHAAFSNREGAIAKLDDEVRHREREEAKAQRRGPTVWLHTLPPCVCTCVYPLGCCQRLGGRGGGSTAQEVPEPSRSSAVLKRAYVSQLEVGRCRRAFLLTGSGRKGC